MDKPLEHSSQMAKKQGHKTPLKSGLEKCNDCVAPFKDASDEEIASVNKKKSSKGKPSKEKTKRACSSPLMVEDIIEGFAFASFKSIEDLEVCLHTFI